MCFMTVCIGYTFWTTSRVSTLSTGWNGAARVPFRCSGSLSLREFLWLESRDRLPDHSWLSNTRTSGPRQYGFSRWRGDEAARRAVTNNRVRLKSGGAREAFKLRAEIVGRSFAHNLDRGDMCRTCGKQPVGSAISSNRRNA